MARGSIAEQLKRDRRRKSTRLRSKAQMQHKPSGFGKGRWHSRTTLWKARMKARRKRKIARASRKANWAA